MEAIACEIDYLSMRDHGSGFCRNILFHGERQDSTWIHSREQHIHDGRLLLPRENME